MPNGDPNNTGSVFDYPGRLSGYYGDKETGNFYAQQRDAYNPAIGAFPQSDPIGLMGGLNPYSYVGAAPIRFIDPDGLFEVLPADVTDAFFQSLSDAYDKGYYSCLGDCLSGGLISPVSGLLVKEGLIASAEHAGAADVIAKKYYTATDVRFTAGGKYSRVLVPQLRQRITVLAKGVSVVGFLLFYKDIYSCTKKCLTCLNQEKE